MTEFLLGPLWDPVPQKSASCAWSSTALISFPTAGHFVIFAECWVGWETMTGTRSSLPTSRLAKLLTFLLQLLSS